LREQCGDVSAITAMIVLLSCIILTRGRFAIIPNALDSMS
jgi:hypothetical protein